MLMCNEQEELMTEFIRKSNINGPQHCYDLTLPIAAASV